MANAGAMKEFLSMCARGEVRAAYDRFTSADFVHHNAWFPGDRESLIKAMEDSAATEPNTSFEVKQAIEDGDRVATLSHLVRADGQTAYAVVHIARFVGDRIVEFWDVAQEIPRDSPNERGMF